MRHTPPPYVRGRKYNKYKAGAYELMKLGVAAKDRRDFVAI
jgi:hypothetical protein